MCLELELGHLYHNYDNYEGQRSVTVPTSLLPYMVTMISAHSMYTFPRKGSSRLDLDSPEESSRLDSHLKGLAD